MADPPTIRAIHEQVRSMVPEFHLSCSDYQGEGCQERAYKPQNVQSAMIIDCDNEGNEYTVMQSRSSSSVPPAQCLNLLNSFKKNEKRQKHTYCLRNGL